MKRTESKNNYGFTLIELVVYLGLFAILMGGMVTAAYSVFESSDRDQTKIMIQEEGDFIIAKINWALSGEENVNINSPEEMSVDKLNTSETGTTKVIFKLLGTDLYISQAGNTPVALNNSNVQVNNLVFSWGQDCQECIEASFNISAKTFNGMSVSQNFLTVKYLRK